MIQLLHFQIKDLLDPLFYINNGGIWIVLLIVFSETGIMIGFFLPGDSLLFVSGIYSKLLIGNLLKGGTGNDFIDTLFLFILIAVAGVLGNEIGYWFGYKSGSALYKKQDSVLFKKRYLTRAKDLYNKHGAAAIVIARFLPIVRTFAPVVAGIVKMDKKKFFIYNIVGSAGWVFLVVMAGHYLENLFLDRFGFDLKQHIIFIVIFLVLATTTPVIYKLILNKKKDEKSRDK